MSYVAYKLERCDFKNYIKSVKKEIIRQLECGIELKHVKEGIVQAISKFQVLSESDKERIYELVDKQVGSMQFKSRDEQLDELIEKYANNMLGTLKNWKANFETKEELFKSLENNFKNRLSLDDETVKKIIDRLKSKLDSVKEATGKVADTLSKYFDTNANQLNMKDIRSDAQYLGITDLNGNKDTLIRRIREKAKEYDKIKVDSYFVCQRCGHLTNEITAERTCPECNKGKLVPDKDIDHIITEEKDLYNVNNILTASQKEIDDLLEILSYNDTVDFSLLVRPFVREGVIRTKDGSDFEEEMYEFSYSSSKDVHLKVYVKRDSKYQLCFTCDLEITTTKEDGNMLMDLKGNKIKYVLKNLKLYRTKTKKDATQEEVSKAIDDIIQMYIVITTGFNWRMINHEDKEVVEVPAQVNSYGKKLESGNKASNNSTQTNRKKSRRVIYLSDGGVVYTYDRTVYNAFKEHKCINIAAWGVHGHYRHYKKSGKVVYIDSYAKGKEREKFNVTDLLRKGKVDVRGDRENYL